MDFIGYSGRDFLTGGLGFWEIPFPVQYLGARPVKAHHVVPVLHDWQAVGDSSIATTELNRDGTVAVLLRRNVVE
jgi:hypothetical protein